MFTGIIEELGQIQSITTSSSGSACFEIQASLVLQDLKIGDSLAVNGCCLTAIEFQSNTWKCEVVPETLNKTTLQQLQLGELVNLERALQWNGRLHGHLVQGHIDGIGIIQSKELLPDGSWWITIQASPDLLRYIIYKGSIAVDGVSLTIAQVTDTAFAFAMIPHTTKVTTLGIKESGAMVNLEIDLMAKYAERLLMFVHQEKS